MSLIYLIRHGQASFGAADYDSLSETGERQARILGDFFRDTGVVFDHVCTGAMTRQKDTAAIVRNTSPRNFRRPETDIIPELDEHDSGNIIRSQIPGLLEEEPALEEDVKKFFKDKKSFQRLFAKVMARWVSGEHDVEGVESYGEFCRRVENGFERIAGKTAEGEKTAVFTSGGVIAAVMRLALDIPGARAMRLPWWTRNASYSVVRAGRGGVDLLSFNSTAHLEMHSDPGLLTYK